MRSNPNEISMPGSFIQPDELVNALQPDRKQNSGEISIDQLPDLQAMQHDSDIQTDGNSEHVTEMHSAQDITVKHADGRERSASSFEQIKQECDGMRGLSLRAIEVLVRARARGQEIAAKRAKDIEQTQKTKTSNHEPEKKVDKPHHLKQTSEKSETSSFIETNIAAVSENSFRKTHMMEVLLEVNNAETNLTTQPKNTVIELISPNLQTKAQEANDKSTTKTEPTINIEKKLILNKSNSKKMDAIISEQTSSIKVTLKPKETSKLKPSKIVPSPPANKIPETSRKSKEHISIRPSVKSARLEISDNHESSRANEVFVYSTQSLPPEIQPISLDLKVPKFADKNDPASREAEYQDPTTEINLEPNETEDDSWIEMIMLNYQAEQTEIDRETDSETDLKAASETINEAPATADIILSEIVESIEMPEQLLEQTENLVEALPEIIGEKLALYIQEAEPEAAMEVKELVIKIAPLADRLHELSLVNELESEAFIQVQKELTEYFEELLIQLNVEADDQLITHFIEIICSQAYGAKKPKTIEGLIDESLLEKTATHKKRKLDLVSAAKHAVHAAHHIEQEIACLMVYVSTNLQKESLN